MGRYYLIFSFNKYKKCIDQQFNFIWVTLKKLWRKTCMHTWIWKPCAISKIIQFFGLVETFLALWTISFIYIQQVHWLSAIALIFFKRSVGLCFYSSPSYRNTNTVNWNISHSFPFPFPCLFPFLFSFPSLFLIFFLNFVFKRIVFFFLTGWHAISNFFFTLKSMLNIMRLLCFMNYNTLSSNILRIHFRSSLKIKIKSLCRHLQCCPNGMLNLSCLICKVMFKNIAELTLVTCLYTLPL